MNSDVLRPLLRCPVTRSIINFDHNEAGQIIACHGGNLNGVTIEYPVVRGQPALVDFENSVLDKNRLAKDMGASPIQRPASERSTLGMSARAALKRHLFGNNKVAEAKSVRLLQLMMERVSSFPEENRPVLLIVGGGTLGLGSQHLYEQNEINLISFDIYASSNTSFVADAHNIPLIDSCVDGVWVQAVLEHVLEPAQVVRELHRVLRPGGLVYADTPFMQQVHEGPYDFTRFTESGHRWLFREFELIESGVVSGPGVALYWSIRYFIAGLLRSRLAGKILSLPFFWLRYFDRVMHDRCASDGASAVFFLGRSSDHSIDPKELIRFYKGAQ